MRSMLANLMPLPKSVAFALLPLLIGSLACSDAGGPLDLGPVDDGFDDEPGSGLTFVVASLRVLPPDETVTVTDCGYPECQTSALGPLAQTVDDRIRMSVLVGESLNVIELAGLADPDRRPGPITVKAYQTADFDEPFFPANNFRAPPDSTTCCEFVPVASALSGNPPQARYRAPANFENQDIMTTERLDVGHVLPVVDIRPVARPAIPVQHVSIRARLSPDGLSLEGQMTGVISSAALVLGEPYLFCPAELEGCAVDGFETAADVVETVVGPPNVCDDERGCWGYSVVFAFQAVPATLREASP